MAGKTFLVAALLFAGILVCKADAAYAPAGCNPDTGMAADTSGYAVPDSLITPPSGWEMPGTDSAASYADSSGVITPEPDPDWNTDGSSSGSSAGSADAYLAQQLASVNMGLERASKELKDAKDYNSALDAATALAKNLRTLEQTVEYCKTNITGSADDYTAAEAELEKVRSLSKDIAAELGSMKERYKDIAEPLGIMQQRILALAK